MDDKEIQDVADAIDDCIAAVEPSSPPAIRGAVDKLLAEKDQTGAVRLLKRVFDYFKALREPENADEKVRVQMGIPLGIWLLDNEENPEVVSKALGENPTALSVESVLNDARAEAEIRHRLGIAAETWEKHNR